MISGMFLLIAIVLLILIAFFSYFYFLKENTYEAKDVYLNLVPKEHPINQCEKEINNKDNLKKHTGFYDFETSQKIILREYRKVKDTLNDKDIGNPYDYSKWKAK